jgi:hypothetical protein
MGHIFISYSRRQLYFAESLTLHLQKHGFAVWFDLQRLRAGSDWASELKAGVETCDQLILVASRAALKSPYVAKEWQSALAEGKPVYVVVYEALNLPDQLRGLPTFDFRTRFDTKLGTLVAALKGETVQIDPVPHPNFLRLPFIMPATVWLTLLLLAQISLFVSQLLSPALPVIASIVPIYVTLLGASAAWMWYATFQFWRHQTSYINVRQIILIPYGVFFTFLLLFIIVSFAGASSPRSPLREYSSLVPLFAATLSVALVSIVLHRRFRKANRHTTWQWGLAFIILLTAWTNPLALLAAVSYFYRSILPTSPNLLRWFSAGRVPQTVRTTINSNLLKGKPHTGIVEPTRIRYRLHFQSADTLVATQVRSAMSGYGHQEVNSDDADFHICVVSNFTPESQAKALAERYGGRFIGIIAATIRIPQYMEDFARYQWVDYRNRSDSRLQQFAQSLYNQSASSVQLGLETVPEDVQSLRTPDRVTGLAVVLRNGGAFALATSLLSVVLPGNLGDVSLSSLVIAASVIQGALYFQTAGDVLQRRVTLSRVVTIMVGSTVLVGGTMIFDVPGQVAISSLLPSIVGLVVVLAYVYRDVKRWLPQHPGNSGGQTMAADITQRVWLLNGLWFVGSIAILLPVWLARPA